MKHKIGIIGGGNMGEAIIAGRYHDQFPIDPYQGGAGTSTNMNTNEVMANVALELTGHKLGEYDIIEPHECQTIANFTKDFYAGNPAITVNEFGEGKAIYIGTVSRHGEYLPITSSIALESNAGPIG